MTEKTNPLFTFGNLGDAGWGAMQGQQTPAQIKAVRLLLTIRCEVRVYHDQAAARAAAYGVGLSTFEEYIALDVDGGVYLCSPGGFFHRTTLRATGEREPHYSSRLDKLSS